MATNSSVFTSMGKEPEKVSIFGKTGDTLMVITLRIKNPDPARSFGQTDEFTTATLTTIIFTDRESTSPKMGLFSKIRVGIKVRNV
jgi:hypothetical protein